MSPNPPDNGFVCLKSVWAMPEEHISMLISDLSGGPDRNQALLCAILIHGIHLKREIAQSWAERGGRKVAGFGLNDLLTDPATRELLRTAMQNAERGGPVPPPLSELRATGA